MKYAIIETGGKQYKVKEGDTLDAERIQAKDSKIEFDKVLLLSDGKDIKVGNPYIKEVKVRAGIIGENKADKALSFKYRRRKSSYRKRGHRQVLSRVKIEMISET
ncbi:MAG: 50S ribosomal protein L21 [Candidatus Omnitrophica bacterium]|nr:50S ribosomal protein L21 [Candidatus Omnitrophota bacterium]